MNQKGFLKGILLGVLVLSVGILAPSVKTYADGFYGNPIVTFSPDSKAWTVKEELPSGGDAANKVDPACWYRGGEYILLQEEKEPEMPSAGEHIYRYERRGLVPVLKWEVIHPRGQCIHCDEHSFHSVVYGELCCGASYYSGWHAYCADCGEKINLFNIYMSKGAVSRLTEIDVSLDYYYLCPTCNHLEQGRSFRHKCRGISANRYAVQYLQNGGNVTGTMPLSFHMYGNTESYEGQTVTPVRKLSRNAYSRIGYRFSGWNTMPDGSGESFSDGQEILNLSAENYSAESGEGVVKLYAQWQKVTGTLLIDPAGGSYLGSREITAVSVGYGATYTLNSSLLTAPADCLVSFDTMGGEAIAPVRGEKTFYCWRAERISGGKLLGDRYQFLGEDGQQDLVCAVYQSAGIRLPKPVKSGYSFGGWYKDPACSSFAGRAGDRFTPDKDTVLYASWVELLLSAELNLTAHDKRGAVDLEWSQPDGKDKMYLLFQKREGGEFERIHDADEASVQAQQEFYDQGKTIVYPIIYSGIYSFSAKGSQGQRYDQWEGGPGGSVDASFYLEQGDELEIRIGGSGPLGGGGMGRSYGRGGGATTVSSKNLGTLLVAGGGGGGSPAGPGGGGGFESGQRLDQAGQGEPGEAGGGSGYVGGGAGNYQRHIHTENCLHKHLGDEINGGECYRLIRQERICKVVVKGPFTEEAGAKDCQSCIRAGRDGYGKVKVHCWRIIHDNCGQATDYGNSGWWECSVCGEIVYQWGSGTNKPNVSNHPYTAMRYVLNCNKHYDCNEPEGHGLPAFGGSNYVNQEAALEYVMRAGEWRGEGMLTVSWGNIGFRTGQSLEGVFAPDLMPPDKICEISLLGTDSLTELEARFLPPSDQGTNYYHQAHSYLKGSDQVLSKSNITLTEVVTGVAGYYYLVDDHPGTVIRKEELTGDITFLPATVSGGDYTSYERIRLPLPDHIRYLHIAPVDVAGNLGETATVNCSPDAAGSSVKPVTEPIGISSVVGEMDYQNVYDAGEKVYYVRADGMTPFLLSFRGSVQGNGTSDEQIDRAMFEYEVPEMALLGSYTAYLPRSGSPGDGQILCEIPESESAGAMLLQKGMYGCFSREGMQNAMLWQSFRLSRSCHGKKLSVIPIAAVSGRDSVILSDREQDEEHGLWLIGDGEAPVISGVENAEALLTGRSEEEAVSFELTAMDSLSGVAEFTAVLRNLDNGEETVYFSGEDGKIRISLVEDSPLFIGDLHLTLRARDRVGNENELECGVEEFGVKAEIVRVLSPHDPIFKKGESGILKIKARGFADRIEVEFPEDFSEKDDTLNRCFEYEIPQSITKEEVLFMVPLSIEEERQYEITVRAYKNGALLEDRPKLCTLLVTDTILNELRTRLR